LDNWKTYTFDNVIKIGWEDVDRIRLAKGRTMAGSGEEGNGSSKFHKTQ
jgi:hypothetical protein